MAQHDLTKKILPNLDPHMMIPVIDFITSRDVYSQKDMANAKIEVVKKTNMVDHLVQLWQAANPDAETPAEFSTKREETVNTMNKLREAIKAFTDVFPEEDAGAVVEKLRGEDNFKLEYLTAEYKITEKTLVSLYHYAKFMYEIGVYSKAAELLFYYRLLSPQGDFDTSARWGKLAAEILTRNWEIALDDLKHLGLKIDTASSSLQARTWFIHWALFVYFNHTEGQDGFIELFFDNSNMFLLSTLQTTCPYMLRYVAAAVILSRRKRQQYIKELISLVEQERNNHHDPITEFIECLYIDYDFEAAQSKLQQCTEVLANDYFLHSFVDQFIENARLMIFENYCRIHTVIDIGMVADKLGMDTEKAEIWIVNLIRQAQLDATVDAQANQVIMNSNSSDVYQKVMEKAKNLTMRTFVQWKQLPLVSC